MGFFWKKYRAFIANDLIADVAKKNPALIGVTATMCRVDYQNGTDLYWSDDDADFDYLKPFVVIEER